MPWIEAIFKTSSDKIDELVNDLIRLGAEGLVIEDENDFRNFLESNKQYWDYVDEELENRYAGISRVKIYVTDDAEGKKTLSNYTEALHIEPDCSVMDETDWENNWKQYYKPLEIGEKILIVPSWETVDDTTRSILRLDPGLTFGTGSHATTRMCLEEIENYVDGDKNILDLGCGSGILGIGAMVLGAKAVIGCDIDPLSPKVATENALLNDITSDNFKIYAGDLIADASVRKMLKAECETGFDLVLANIVSDVIIPLAPYAREFMAKDAVFICSGIIEGRQDEVKAELIKNGYEIIKHKNSENWHCFVCR